MFHAFTGCETTSAFRGKDKVSVWKVWQVYVETLIYLASHPFEHLDYNSKHFERIERMIVILYDRTSSLSSVNDAREELFCRRN